MSRELKLPGSLSCVLIALVAADYFECDSVDITTPFIKVTLQRISHKPPEIHEHYSNDGHLLIACSSPYYQSHDLSPILVVSRCPMNV